MEHSDHRLQILVCLLLIQVTSYSGYIYAESGIVLYFGENAQTEVHYKNTSVYMDVWNSAKLSCVRKRHRFLTVSHAHEDHYNSLFVERFKGQSLVFQTGALTTLYSKP